MRALTLAPRCLCVCVCVCVCVQVLTRGSHSGWRDLCEGCGGRLGADEAHSRDEVGLGKKHGPLSTRRSGLGDVKAGFVLSPLSVSREGHGHHHTPQREGRGALPGRAAMGRRHPPWAGPEGH